MLPLIKRSLFLEALYFVMIFLICSFETTAWYFLFPQITLPSLWFIVISYLATFRSSIVFLVYSFILSFIISSFSVAPFFNIHMGILISGFGLAYLRSQFYAKDRFRFSAYTALSFLVYSLVLSLFNINFYSWSFWSATLLKCLIISISSFVVFPICQLLDDVNREQTHMDNVELPV